ncbi:MAG: hypothetical protein AAB621_00870 [Patescibacteria group bacterium]
MNKKSKISIFLSVLIVSASIFVGLKVFAATNIDATNPNYYAWNDVIGWIDFYSTGNVYISGSTLIGFASSSVGYIAFDCGTSPNPPADCSTTFSNWKVTNTGGTLTGWAWNDQIGWISFNCSNVQDPCISPVYGVSLSGVEFSGWAWNDVIGWISFNCSNSGTNGCTTPGIDYKVKKSGGGITASAYLVSSTFDTGAASGVVYNTLLYQGSKPTGTQVGFQLAVSDSSSGPWSFSGYDGTDTTYYTPTSSNVPIALNSTLYKNKRYFRYKVFLDSDVNRTVTPRVDDVVVTWSR